MTGQIVRPRFIYFVQSGFHPHAHIHRLKIQFLREAGLEAEVVSVVSWREIARHPAQYGSQARDLGVKILGVPHAALAAVRMSHFAARALRQQDVIVQVLRSAWPNTRRLRRVARWQGRLLACLLELEGDHEAEADYLARHPYKPGFYRQAIEDYYRRAPGVRRAVQDADGLVLMSTEHIRMWEARVGRPLRAVAMPAMFDPGTMQFDASARREVRGALGIQDRTVLVYSGNVYCSWQKFGSACRILARMTAAGIPAFLLALIRSSDHSIADEFLIQHGVKSISRLLYVPPGDLNRYLSAADLGFFLREDHPMNRIVTSAKLGEYLACGLPVVTTGVGGLYHDYMRAEGLGVFLDHARSWGSIQNAQAVELATHSQDPDWRTQISAGMRQRFSGSRGVSADYVRFVSSFLDPETRREVST